MIKTFYWNEYGWYDCCSGHWFITYELREGFEVILTAHGIIEAKVMTLVLFCSGANCYKEWLEENYEHFYEEVERVEEYKEEHLNNMLTKNGIVCNIIRDEEIDYDWDWRCDDD